MYYYNVLNGSIQIQQRIVKTFEYLSIISGAVTCRYRTAVLGKHSKRNTGKVYSFTRPILVCPATRQPSKFKNGGPSRETENKKRAKHCATVRGIP